MGDALGLDTVRPYLGENPGCASGHMSGAVVDLVCSDQLSRGLRAWQARSRHATGERIGDCDLMRSTSASCARQRWSGNARSMTSVKRAAGTALSVVVVLFDHHKSLRNHRDTRTLEQFAILSRTISVCHERRTSHTGIVCENMQGLGAKLRKLPRQAKICTPPGGD